ncbi:MAG: GNAT family N-acetyltransferase [Pseudomonadota bacterium]
MTKGHVENAPDKVKAFVECFSHTPVQVLIENLITQVEYAEIDGRAFPLTVNEVRAPGNCYICNPVTGYVDYALDETRNFAASPVLQRMVNGVIRAAAPLVRATGLDHVVHVNNWLFSTNPVPDLDGQVAAEIRDQLVAHYPNLAIVLRSLNTIADPVSIAACRAAGCRLLPSRQIYIFDPRAQPATMTKAMKQDRAKLRNTPYHLAENHTFSEPDYTRCAELYDLLYLQKYTHLNPQYSAEYIAQMHHRGLIELMGLRDDQGRLVAVTGLFENGNTLTQPIVGYDTTLPRGDGLYRMVMAMGQDRAIKRNLFFNMSAGAADFKRRRGALPAIEYSAVYTGHLSLRRRLATRWVEMLLRHIGVPLLQRFEL